VRTIYTKIEFLEEFHTHFGGEKVTLIWDGLPSHTSKAMKAWIRTQRRWLIVEQLPDYSPDLNPVELVWGNVKGRELANLCPDTMDEAEAAADGAPCCGWVTTPSSVSTSSPTPVSLCDQVLTVLPKDLYVTERSGLGGQPPDGVKAVRPRDWLGSNTTPFATAGTFTCPQDTSVF
jgi:hypothetical protein